MATAEHKGHRASRDGQDEDLHEGLDDADVEHLDDDDVPIPRETGPVPRATHQSFMRAARTTRQDDSAMLPGASLPREGGLIAGKYRVDGVHERDSMVVTLKATHVELGKTVWVRYLLPRAVRRHDAIARFMSASRAVAKMKSDHAARVLDVGRIRSGIPFVVIDDMSGWDLDEIVRVRGPLPVQEAVEYVLQAAEAIAEAHTLGMIHGSLRPSNVLLARRDDDSPLVKVVGFELADVVDWTAAAAGGGEGAPSPSWFASTLPYLAPEQIRSADQVDERVDVWALGAILHALLTGAPPFRARTPAALLAAVAADEPRQIGEVRGDVAEELEELIFRCLSKNPADRPANVGEIAQTLTPFAPGDGLSVIDRISRMPSSSVRPPPVQPTPAPRGYVPPSRAIVPVPRARIQKREKEAPKPPPAPSAQWLLVTALVGLGTSVLGATAVILVANSSANRGARDDPAATRSQETRVQGAPEAVAPPMPPAAPAKVAEPAPVQQQMQQVRAAQPVERVPLAQNAEPVAKQAPPPARPARASSGDAVARSDNRPARVAAQGAASDTPAKNATDLFNDTR